MKTRNIHHNFGGFELYRCGIEQFEQVIIVLRVKYEKLTTKLKDQVNRIDIV